MPFSKQQRMQPAKSQDMRASVLGKRNKIYERMVLAGRDGRERGWG